MREAAHTCRDSPKCATPPWWHGWPGHRATSRDQVVRRADVLHSGCPDRRFAGRPGDPDRSYYRRVERDVVLADGRVVTAWVYVPGTDLLAQVEEHKRVPSGDWLP